jgi:hypothetical protein
MTKDSRSRSEKKHQANSTLELNTTPKKSRRVPLWQALLLPVTAVAIFFLLLEGGLALFGIKPVLQTEDPFVGFASNAPLFVPLPGSKGGQILATAPNKKDYFNRQSFPREKGPGTFRIFCLGGSTVQQHTDVPMMTPPLLPAGFVNFYPRLMTGAETGRSLTLAASAMPATGWCT